MDFPQIGYFLNLAETLNFTEAAMRSGVSQPTLTRSIQRLEEELGGTLIYRDGKDTRLTALGRELQMEFERIRESEDRVRSLAQNRVYGKRETLNLGVSNTLAPKPVSRFMAHILGELPMLEVVLHPIPRDMATEMLLAGRLDGCFVSDGPKTHPKLAVEDLFEERLLLALATKHKLAGQEEVSLQALGEQPYFDRLNCEFRTRIADHLRHQAVVMFPRLRSEREDLIQQAVADGAGVCMLPEFSVIVPGLVLRPVEEIRLKRQVSFLSISGSGNAMALQQLRKLLQNYDWQSSLVASKL